MLSILIPIYNFDVRPFIRELHRQASVSGKPFEILCYDDGSEETCRNINREIGQLAQVTYREMKENTGRSAIRNRLAEDARYEYLLFLDCDSYPEREDMIGVYLSRLSPGALLYGGRSYSPQAPADSEQYFRWFYGSRREVAPVQQRQKKPWHSFQTNNFVIPREVFLSVKLDETLKGYGHEDTLLGMELKKRKIPVLHLDNPLRHLGLENTQEFLEKTLQGIGNLASLIRRGVDPEMIRLARAYRMLRGLGLCPLYLRWFRAHEEKLLASVHSTAPSLRNFDLYKLGLLASTLLQDK